MTLEDNVKILGDVFSKYKECSISGIELNLSCPNIIGKPQVGYDFEAFRETLRRVYELDVPGELNGNKLPPYFDTSHWGMAFDVVRDFPLDTITCINSVGNGLVVVPVHECSVISPKKGLGGIGGSHVKSVALSNVFQFFKILNAM